MRDDEIHASRARLVRRLAPVCLVTLAATCAWPTDHSPGDGLISVRLRSADGAVRLLPPGPFVSVIDSADVLVTTPGGAVLAHRGAPFSRYATSIPIQVRVPEGRARFAVQVLSTNGAVLLAGAVDTVVTGAGQTLEIVPQAGRSVLVALPDTLFTSGPSSGTFTVFNAGSVALVWSVATLDTAFTRCGASCSVASATTVAPGAGTPLTFTLPPSFPSRNLSFVLRSAEGDVPIVWRYVAPTVASVLVTPRRALLLQRSTLQLSAAVQSNGSTAVTWSSLAPSVAPVSASGEILAAAPGSAYIRAVSDVDSTKRDSVLVRVYGGVNNTLFFTAPVVQDTVRRDATSGDTTALLRARSVGPAGTFQNPYALVEFWGREMRGTTWRHLGNATVTVTDSLTTRIYAYSLTWNPSPENAPFADPSITRMELVAIGVAGSGAVTRSPSDTLLLVRVP